MRISMLVVAACAAPAALAQMPQMGGPMKHVMVHLHGTALEGHVDGSIPTPELKNYGEIYLGNAAVLNGKYYNAQYGWMKDGIWSVPTGSVLWIEQLSATPGLEIYQGGMMSNMGMHTFAGIFGTGGSSSRIQWSGSMLHNWYAATAVGDYSATYRLYFGDANGDATAGYDADEVTINFTVIPAPGILGLAGFAGLVVTRRRR